MPEGPELAIAAAYIRRICTDKVFSRLEKSSVSKCADIPWKDGDEYKISATSRGKELMLCMESIGDEATKGEPSSSSAPSKLHILFHFGMSGRFAFTATTELPKHSHLRFITSDGTGALSFVDTRRFGRWEAKKEGSEWSLDRGPCALTEYEKFRENISKSLDDSAFTRPLCEVMLDQRYFNGIGNYLRAEIIFRAGVPPFNKARDVLQAIFDAKEEAGTGTEAGNTKDLVALCQIVQQEVLELQSTYYTSPDHYLSDNDTAFDDWLKCYGKSTMRQMRDSNKRTMWFTGPAGSMAAKGKEVIKKPKKKPSNVKKEVAEDSQAETEQDTPAQESTESSTAVKSKKRVTVTKILKTEQEFPNPDEIPIAKKSKRVNTRVRVTEVVKVEKEVPAEEPEHDDNVPILIKSKRVNTRVRVTKVENTEQDAPVDESLASKTVKSVRKVAQRKETKIMKTDGETSKEEVLQKETVKKKVAKRTAAATALSEADSAPGGVVTRRRAKMPK